MMVKARSSMIATSGSSVAIATTRSERLAVAEFRRKVSVREGYISADLSRRHFPDSYDFQPTTIILCAQRQGKIIGSLRLHTGLSSPLEELVDSRPFYARGEAAEISRLCVEPEERSQGLAQELIASASRLAAEQGITYLLFLAIAGIKQKCGLEYLPLIGDCSRKPPISPYFSFTETEEQLYQKLAAVTLPGWYGRLGAKPAGYLFLHPVFNTVNLPMYGEVKSTRSESAIPVRKSKPVLDESCFCL